MDVHIHYYNERNAAPVHTEPKVVGSIAEADAWAQAHYRDHKAKGYVITDPNGTTAIEQWDERRNATWP